MDAQELISALQATLDDYKLSRSERRALHSVLESMPESTIPLIRSHIFKMAREATIDPETIGVISWLEDATKLLARDVDASPADSDREEALFSKQHDCSQRICAMFAMAQRWVDICVFTITDNDIFRAIIKANQRNVRIRLITDDEKSHDEGSDVADLQRHGIEVRTDQTPDHMHHKYAIFDSKKVLTGSYNWTRSAATRNEENLIISDNRDLIKQFEKHFDGLWDEYS